jgi:hypothetical protein
VHSFTVITSNAASASAADGRLSDTSPVRNIHGCCLMVTQPTDQVNGQTGPAPLSDGNCSYRVLISVRATCTADRQPVCLGVSWFT